MFPLFTMAFIKRAVLKVQCRWRGVLGRKVYKEVLFKALRWRHGGIKVGRMSLEGADALGRSSFFSYDVDIPLSSCVSGRIAAERVSTLFLVFIVCASSLTAQFLLQAFPARSPRACNRLSSRHFPHALFERATVQPQNQQEPQLSVPWGEPYGQSRLFSPKN